VDAFNIIGNNEKKMLKICNCIISMRYLIIHPYCLLILNKNEIVTMYIVATFGLDVHTMKVSFYTPVMSNKSRMKLTTRKHSN